MAWLPVDALESGMTLASDLKGPDGNMLLPKGIVLTESHIASLRRRGVVQADVGAGQDEAMASAANLDPALIEASAQYVVRRFAANDVEHPAVAAVYEAAVLRHFEGRLARFKHPRAVVTAASLPRNALGKVQVAALKALVAE